MQPVEFRFLDRPKEVEAYLTSLRTEPAVALDLEADSLHNYREKICLLQVSTSSATTVLDPLTSRDALQVLGPLLSDEGVQKILHGGDYDVRLLKKDFGFGLRNVFDTMIAAQFTGRAQFGLAALLEEHFGVKLDKKHQRADWSLRPLGPELLSYAALDTAYLFELKTRLEEELARLGRLEWIQEEFRLLEAVEPSPPKTPWCLDVKGAGRLPPRQLAILQALLEVRDQAAREWDRPPFKVLSNDVLLNWAQSPPSSRKDVLEVPGAGKGVLGRLAGSVLEAVQKARSLPAEAWPRPTFSPQTPLSGAQERRLKRLKKAREAAAERLGLSPGLLVNSATLERLCRLEAEEALASLPTALKRWQLAALGEVLRLSLTPSGDG